jgi:hypothetical protein
MAVSIAVQRCSELQSSYSISVSNKCHTYAVQQLESAVVLPLLLLMLLVLPDTSTALAVDISKLCHVHKRCIEQGTFL